MPVLTMLTAFVLIDAAILLATNRNLLHHIITIQPPPTYLRRATLADLRAAGSSSCSICLDRFAGLDAKQIAKIAPGELVDDDEEERCDKPSKLACGHVFGRKCLLQWLGRHRRCPLCREGLREVGAEPRRGMEGEREMEVESRRAMEWEKERWMWLDC